MTLAYRKKKFSGLYTKWDSFTTRKYNVNLLRTLTFRFVQKLLFTYVASIYSQRFAKTSPSKWLPTKNNKLQHQRHFKEKPKQAQQPCLYNSKERFDRFVTLFRFGEKPDL